MRTGLQHAPIPPTREAWLGSASAFRTQLEGTVERTQLIGKLADGLPAFGVGCDVGFGLALLAALVDVEHGVVHQAVAHSLDDDRLLAAVAGRPDAALRS